MYSPERDPLGSSDNPITKPQKEWRRETQDKLLSPEDQAALREFLTQYIRAKKKDDQYRMGMAASEIAELTGKKLVDESDVDALAEEFGMDIDFGMKEKEISLKPHETIEETETQEQITETAGRERSRHGTNLPPTISIERHLSPKDSKLKIIKASHKGRSAKGGKRTNKEEKPAWKSRRTKKRKTAMTA